MSILALVSPGVNFKRRPKRNPRDRWPVWTDANRWTINDQKMDIEPDPPAFEPTPRQAAWNAGYCLGYEHNSAAVPPADMSDSLKLSWWTGRNLGWLRRESDDLLIDRRQLSYEPGIPHLTDADIWPAGCMS